MSIRFPFFYCITLAMISVATVTSAASIQFREGSMPHAGYDMVALDMRSSATQQNNVREGDDALIIGRISDGDNARGILAFDISAIPSGSTITSVTLTLTKRVADTSASVSEDHTITVHELVGTFLQDTTNGPSWNNRDQGAMTAWGAAGGDHDPTVLSSVTANAKTTVLGDLFTFASSSDFVTSATNALNGSGTMYMLLKSADSEADNDRGLFQFLSDNDSRVDFRPMLTVEYVPEPASFALLGVGVLGLLLQGARRRTRKS